MIRAALMLAVLCAGCSSGGGSGRGAAPAGRAAPDAPSAVAATALSATTVRVTWQDNAANEDGFRIERAVGAGGFVLAGTAGVGVMTFDDTGVAASTPYLYRVVAYNAQGDTGSLNQAFVTTPAAGPPHIRKPVGAVSGVGYYDANPFMGYLSGMGYHLGQDWNGNGGGDSDYHDPVYVVADGIVRAARDFGRGWGNIVMIEHDLGGAKYVSLYAHLDALDPALPAVGQAIAEGTVVGGIGKGYNNTEYVAHLHFEFREGTSIQAGPGYVSGTVSKGPQGQVDPTPFY